ncbi:hypothetical protein EJB05_29473, partial [Eragrostis curvula]
MRRASAVVSDTRSKSTLWGPLVGLPFHFALCLSPSLAPRARESFRRGEGVAGLVAGERFADEGVAAVEAASRLSPRFPVWSPVREPVVVSLELNGGVPSLGRLDPQPQLSTPAPSPSERPARQRCPPSRHLLPRIMGKVNKPTDLPSSSRRQIYPTDHGSCPVLEPKK